MNSAEIILEALQRASSPQQRETQLRFFKCGYGEYGYGDKFLGVMVPQVRSIVKQNVAACTFDDLEILLSSPYHEARLAGLLVLCSKFHSDIENQLYYVTFYLQHIESINNWDLVDLTCSDILGNWLLTHNRSILYSLVQPNQSLWANRIAIVTTLAFIRKGQFEDTLALADKLLHHPHDLIHKAVGWMLREVGKRNQDELETFLKPRYLTMPRTMLRYAIERFPEPLRQRYLGN